MANPILSARLDAAAQSQERKNNGLNDGAPAAVAGAGVPVSAGGAIDGAWGNYGAFSWRGYDPRRDAARSVGNPLENSLLYSALDWQATTFQQAPFIVMGTNAEGVEEQVAAHPLARLIKRPMQGWSRSRFWRATLASRFLNGNYYWKKVRDDYGDVAELQWLHHNKVRWIEDEAGHISHYEYRWKNQVIRIEIEDIVHGRDGIDPDNPHSGFSRYRAIVKPIASQGEADQFEDIILHNLGIPGAMISPATTDGTISPKDAEKITATYTARTTGNERGKAMVFPVAVKAEFPTLNPASFGLNDLHERVESAVSMVMKIPAVVLQTRLGLKTSSAKASYRDSEALAWNWNIIPTQDEITEECDTQLLGDLGDPSREWTAFDRSQIEALQENRDELHARVRDDYDSGFIDRAEARGETNREVRDEDAGVWGAKTAPKADGKKDDDAQK